tara:strand:- start:6741 stop:8489 length:1749 start_codon:yes stop_codon:yes gene_type:complete
MINKCILFKTLKVNKVFFEKINKLKILVFGILSLLIFTALFSGQKTIPPIDRDEARFAQASRQMVLSNDFINIKFQDEIRAKKPIGIYWLQSFAAKMFGYEDISSFRIPSLLSSFISIVFLTLITRLIFSFEQSLLVALFFGSSFVFVGEAHLAKTDSALLSLICIQQFLLLKIILSKKKSFKIEYVYPSFLWLVFAFGVLVKGPVSIAILFSTIISFCFFQKSINLLKSIKPVLGILICSIIIIPWFLAIQEATNGLFFQKAFNEDFFNKLQSGQEGHGAWPGTHLLLLSITLWPIATFLPSLILFCKENKNNLVVRFLICWIVPFWIMIEITPTKLIHYPLPILPAVTILTIGGLFQFKHNISKIKSLFIKNLVYFFSIFLGLGGILLGVIIFYISNNFEYQIDNHLFLSSILVLTITLLVFTISLILIFSKSGIFINYQNFISNIPIAIIALGALFHIINFKLIFPNLDYFYPSKIITKKIEKIKPDAVASAGYHEPSLVFMLNGNVLLSTPNEVAIFMAEGQKNVGLIEDNSLSEFLEFVDELSLKIVQKETVKGFNIAKGKHIKIHIFTNQTFDQFN